MLICVSPILAAEDESDPGWWDLPVPITADECPSTYCNRQLVACGEDMPCTFQDLNYCDTSGWAIKREAITITNVQYGAGDDCRTLKGFELEINYPLGNCPTMMAIPYTPDSTNHVVVKLVKKSGAFSNNLGTAPSPEYDGATVVRTWLMRVKAGSTFPRALMQYQLPAAISEQLENETEYALEVELFQGTQLTQGTMTGRKREILNPCKQDCPNPDLSVLRNMSVAVQGDQNCPENCESEGCPGDPSFASLIKDFGGSAQCFYQFCVTVEGTVEGMHSGYDYARVGEPGNSANNTVFLQGTGEGKGCASANIAAQKIITVYGGRLELSYDTVDSCYNDGGKAQITNIEFIRSWKNDEQSPGGGATPPASHNEPPCLPECYSPGDCDGGDYGHSSDPSNPGIECRCIPCEDGPKTCDICENKLTCTGPGQFPDPSDPCKCAYTGPKPPKNDCPCPPCDPPDPCPNPPCDPQGCNPPCTGECMKCVGGQCVYSQQPCFGECNFPDGKCGCKVDEACEECKDEVECGGLTRPCTKPGKDRNGYCTCVPTKECPPDQYQDPNNGCACSCNPRARKNCQDAGKEWIEESCECTGCDRDTRQACLDDGREWNDETCECTGCSDEQRDECAELEGEFDEDTCECSDCKKAPDPADCPRCKEPPADPSGCECVHPEGLECGQCETYNEECDACVPKNEECDECEVLNENTCMCEPLPDEQEREDCERCKDQKECEDCHHPGVDNQGKCVCKPDRVCDNGLEMDPQNACTCQCPEKDCGDCRSNSKNSKGKCECQDDIDCGECYDLEKRQGDDETCYCKPQKECEPGESMDPERGCECHGCGPNASDGCNNYNWETCECEDPPPGGCEPPCDKCQTCQGGRCVDKQDKPQCNGDCEQINADCTGCESTQADCGPCEEPDGQCGCKNNGDANCNECVEQGTRCGECADPGKDDSGDCICIPKNKCDGPNQEVGPPPNCSCQCAHNGQADCEAQGRKWENCVCTGCSNADQDACTEQGGQWNALTCDCDNCTVPKDCTGCTEPDLKNCGCKPKDPPSCGDCEEVDYDNCSCKEIPDCDPPSSPTDSPTDTPGSAAAMAASASASTFGTLNGLEPLGSVMALAPTMDTIDQNEGVSLPEPLTIHVHFKNVSSAQGGLHFVKAKKNFFERLFRPNQGPLKPSVDVPVEREPENPQLYRKTGEKNWLPLPGTYVNGTLTVAAYHYGFYQVFGPIAGLPFSFGEVYVFPNPTTGGNIPTLHVEVGAADKVTARIYDITGDLVYEARIDENHVVINGKPAYEHAMDGSRFKSGVYSGVVTAEKGGRETIRKKFKFSVVK